MSRNLLGRIKDFMILFSSAIIFLFIFCIIFVYSEKLGDTLTIIIIILYLVLSGLLAIYFSARSKLTGDKSYSAVILYLKKSINNFFIELKELLIIFWGIIKVLIVIGIVVWVFSALFSGGSNIESDAYNKGDMSNYGGTPSYRYSNTPSYYDDENTSNDESNDQATGFYGTDTMYACNGNSGNCYDLDVDSDGENIERIYFPKGGWVDVDSSDCDSGYCTVEDENGTEWELEYE